MKHVTLIIILIPIVVNAHILHTQDHRVPAEQLEAERLRERRLRANTNANHRNERDGNAQKEARRRLLLTKRSASDNDDNTDDDDDEHSRRRLLHGRVTSRRLSHGKGHANKNVCYTHGCSKSRSCGKGGTRTREWGKCKKDDGDDAEYARHQKLCRRATHTVYLRYR